MKILLRLLIGFVAVILVTLLGAWLALRGSLPDLDGDRPLAGLSAEVIVERDSLGVPHIRAETRADAARALGYLHAQERRFQMDLLRRAASGELAALLGPDLLSVDSVLRPHLFHETALEALAALPERQRALLDAYAAGVNAGTEALGVRPFEYAVLRQRPTPWRPEDALLVAYAMTIDLQRSDLDDDLATYAKAATLPASLVRFLDPGGDRWDAPLQGAPVDEVAAPPEDSLSGFEPAPAVDVPSGESFLSSLRQEAERVGSNNWAVAGSRTVHGSALVADDMHLGLGVPPIWYRASMTVTPKGPPASNSVSGNPVWGEARRITGVTLPGTPLIVVGSNGHVAWGFTNSYGDYVDLVRLVMTPGDASLVQTDSGTVSITTQREMLEVAGGEAVPLDIERTPWGPVLYTDGNGDRYAVQWGAHRPESVNMNLVDLEGARTLDEAFEIANTAGIPAQNFVAGDREGRIGWTIAGRIPQRVGRSGALPVPSTDPDARWAGFLPPEAVPRIQNPEEGLIWTANA
ncbi:MAG: penicillin acylase family protein, partial [Bacteroidota bacterium]